MIGSAHTRRKWLLPAIAGIVTVAVIAAWSVFRVSELAHIGAGYAAEQTCACLFVSSRSLESCRGDLNPLTRWVVSVRPGTDQVTASSLGLAKATAQYEKNFGCTLQD
jgi:hypothetical protein